MGSESSSAKKFATITGYITLQKVFNVVLYFQRSRYLAPATQPDTVKIHSGKPHLFASRIFQPHKLDTGRTCPLLILVHGGGFVVNNPSRDDPMARFLAYACECLVVCIDYSKAPQHIFPEAYEDVVNISLSVVDDAELPIDKTKVFLCGISAGGNLILAAAQDARLRTKILGVIGLYPVCDAVMTGKEKLATRPDPSVPDILESSYDTILEMYVGDKKPLEDVRLSPGRFAKREDLPPNVYLIGVEHDLLCAEARSMAEKLALGMPKRETTHGWQAEGVRWDLVKGQTHGFDQFGVRGQDEKKRLDQTTETYQAIADSTTEVFKSA